MDTAAVFPVLTLIIGGACVLLLVSTKTLRDSRDDQEKRIKQLEDERTRDKDTIVAQDAEIKFWQKAVTGETHLVAIIELITQHDTKASEHWEHLNTSVEHLDTTMTHLAETMEDKP
jgi:hypothetical protein